MPPLLKHAQREMVWLPGGTYAMGWMTITLKRRPSIA